MKSSETFVENQMKKTLILIAFLFAGGLVVAQNTGDTQGGLQKVRTEVFQRLQQNVKQYSLGPAEKIALAEQLGIPVRIRLADQRMAVFQYLDESDHPVYYTTHNLAAAAATGTNALQEGGSLGLSLAGADMVIGIYDQTRPKASHNEFGNRVTQIDGSTEEISNHATHVTGTILAAGNNRNARGMANQATGWAFNWDADISKMTQNSYDPQLNPQGHLVSNHSYGFLTGWFRDSNNNWAWSGNEGVSPNEDYRFGFYSNKSRQIDELSFSKPYYTIVWAAGNDRSDVGDGSRDSDGPDDSIGPEGVAKNSLTVGAANLLGEYTDPRDVIMSSFSSWGPVDDGRIKPDLVGKGVNVFSSAILDANNGDSYASLSGTSMAAPNVSGSLLLLQELYGDRNAGRYMLSSTVKALAIQTTKEAGMNPGPDYMFGWGLLDAAAAARMIIDEDGSSTVIRERDLRQGEVYEFEFISNGIEPIKATIAWTDPAGSPPSPSLNPTNLMLVNDLDLRIIGEDGTTYFPWTLDPRDGSSAIASNDTDNFRDNVEQIEVTNPAPQRYTLRVSHKGTLTNGLQPFSLVFSAGVSGGQSSTLYWIGSDGNWDNPRNWSLSSDGVAANRIPDAGTRVVIDRPIEGGRIALGRETDVFSLNIFGDSGWVLDLDQNELRVRNGFRSSNNLTELRNGQIRFEGADQNENILDFGQLTFTDIDLLFEQGQWRILSMPRPSSLRIEAATVDFAMDTLSVRSIDLGSDAGLRGNLETIEFGEDFRSLPGASIEPGLDLVFTGENGVFEDGAATTLGHLKNNGGLLELRAAGLIETLELDGETRVLQDNTQVEVLALNSGARLVLSEGQSFTVAETISHSGGLNAQTRIQSAGKATLIHNPYRKYCFDGLSVENVDLQGDAVINLDPQSSVVNAANWSNIRCENVLFANFDVQFNCAGGVTEFINLSEGSINRYRWNFAGFGTSSAAQPTFIFSNARTYLVRLEIAGPGGETTFERRITVNPNSLRKPEIVANGAQLTSRVPAASYQWYNNGVKVPNATERSLLVEDGGGYQVTVIDDQCNRISDLVVVSSTGDDTFSGRAGYALGPNPVGERLSLFMHNDFRGEVAVALFDATGRERFRDEFAKTAHGMEYLMDFAYPAGLYLVQVRAGKEVHTFKVLKE
ncbi:Por secretion system C-terminal sorting domain-containing protein [Cyclobacterium xiamenense]|uniref:Por secretion system C-terminal sorting domain-containing protein n=1 Tax=Cyclobacterium xiamenense TaxID=1297121 RepID=A0A1H7BEB5_9BACT|nr:S8 family serine peptidase [Cyclobacterium xiamenense]SEJ75989.1 Por secretion system C-terminal sorting domain-containing protein [Cyclobacterium xiamenense]